MKVIIEEQVHQSILEFYAVSMRLHPALDEGTVMAKVERLIGAMNDLGKHLEFMQRLVLSRVGLLLGIEKP